jgi:hypothetical protein
LSAIEFEMPEEPGPHNAANFEAQRSDNRKRTNVDKENDPQRVKRPQNAVELQSRCIDFQNDNWVCIKFI